MAFPEMLFVDDIIMLKGRSLANIFRQSEAQPSEAICLVLSEAKPKPECNAPKGAQSLRWPTLEKVTGGTVYFKASNVPVCLSFRQLSQVK